MRIDVQLKEKRFCFGVEVISFDQKKSHFLNGTHMLSCPRDPYEAKKGILARAKEAELRKTQMLKS